MPRSKVRLDAAEALQSEPSLCESLTPTLKVEENAAARRRRIAWIQYYVQRNAPGDLSRAWDLGWDGKAFKDQPHYKEVRDQPESTLTGFWL